MIAYWTVGVGSLHQPLPPFVGLFPPRKRTNNYTSAQRPPFGQAGLPRRGKRTPESTHGHGGMAVMMAH